MKIKMKHEEAYNLIELCLHYDKQMSECPERYEMALQIARDAFYKQTPVKPFVDEGEYACSVCDKLEHSTLGKGDDYCWHCGQKIDWEEIGITS